MNNTRFWPNSIQEILFDADASEIYRHIQGSVNFTSELLSECRRHKEIDEEQDAKMGSRLKDCLRKAGEVRFALSTVDNRLRRERNANPEYRQFVAGLKDLGRRDGVSLMLDIFENNGKVDCPGEIVKFIQLLAPDINLTLMYRIEISELWDEILIVNREMHVYRLISLSHRVTELALQLQDTNVIQKVRKMLSQLNLKVSLPETAPPFNSDPQIMRRTLESEVKHLEASKEHIDQLDEQRKELKRAFSELSGKWDHTQLSSEKETSQPSEPRKRMHARYYSDFRKRRRT